MYGNEIINELGENIADGKGCIVFDFGCHFPYSNQDILTFEFKVGEMQLEPYKHNHRYPNKDYVTISKKMGRRVSKLGYPMFVTIDKDLLMLLEIKIGIKDDTIDFVFPVNVKLTKEKPVCSLSLHFNFDKMSFRFYTYCKKGNGWQSAIWTNQMSEKDKNDKNVVVMNPPTQVEDASVIMYHDILMPYPQALKDLLI